MANPHADLVHLVESHAELWRTPNRIPFATFSGADGAARSASVRSPEFERFVRRLFRSHGVKATRVVVADAVDNAVAAAEEGPVFAPALRCWRSPNEIWIDLCDEGGSAVRIRPGAWDIVKAADCPARFLRPERAAPLPRPEPGGGFEEFGSLLGLDADAVLLVRAFAVGCFLPKGTMPVLCLSGWQGAGKSMLASAIKRIVDPSLGALSDAPVSKRDIMPALADTYLLALDNLEGLSPEMSNTLCRVLSGVPLAARTLHTNLGLTVVETRRPLIIGGISNPATRGDLVDRSISLELKARSGAWKRESELLAALESAAPRVFGALCDALATALAGEPLVPPPSMRLADFAWFAVASCPTVELAEATARVLRSNTEESAASTLENDLFAMAIVDKTRQCGTYEATMRELIDLMLADWARRSEAPPSAEAASRKLDRIGPVLLKSFGIAVERLPRTNTRRPYRFTDLNAAPQRRAATGARSGMAVYDPDMFRDAPLLGDPGTEGTAD